MSYLIFDHIHKSYGDTTALSDVSLEVREGEVFGLLGPNGAGKTTLIRILMDIIRADAGSVTLFGRLRGRDQLDRIGYLPEERGLYTKQKVMDVMVYFGTLKGLDRREARDRSRQWLERMSLSETADWRVERLSKGMSQKVQIATTLLAEPALCVLDEPFAGLDPVNVRLVQDLIQERRRRGWTTVLSTHQMNQVEALCDRVALINEGTVMVYGEVDEVRQRYSSPEVLVRLEGEPPPVPGVVETVRAGNSDWRLRLAEGVSPTDVLAALVREGARVGHFERLLTPMEEVFIQVVQKEERP
jgi:ABC-2 type transport system ATP-binding protein